MQGRHVDGDPRQIGRRGEAHRLGEHPAAELPDHAALFGDADELRGRQRAMDRMVPADQRLGADNRLAVRRIDRLVGEPQLAATIECCAQLALDQPSARQDVVHVAGKNLVAAATVLLCLIERDVGLAQQVVGIRAGVGRHCDADACADEHLVAHQQERPAEVIQQLGAQILGGADVPDVDQYDGEFVAAEAGNGVDLPDAGFEAARGLAHQFVAGRVAERIVDGLEAVEVDVEQRDPAALALRGEEGALQPILEQGAVGEAGQPVVEGEELRMVLARLQLARCAAQASQEEPQHAGAEHRTAQQRRAGLADQRQPRPVRCPPDIAEDDAARIDQRNAGCAGRGEQRQDMGVGKHVLAGDVADHAIVDELDRDMQIFRARLLGEAVRARHQSA